MATTRTVAKKPATRKPKVAAPTPKPAPAPKRTLHGIPELLDRMLLITERAALRIAVMAKRGRRSLLQHA